VRDGLASASPSSALFRVTDLADLVLTPVVIISSIDKISTGYTSSDLRRE
jgi:hypothetical protein